MKTIDEDIKSGQFKKIYLLYGDEAYLKKQYKDKLKKALVQPDDTMNFTAYEGKDTNPKEVIDLSETLPFFADRRVILIENSGFFKGSCEELAEYMPQVPDTTLFLFVEEEVDKRSKLYKAVKNTGKIVEFTTQTEELLTRWILTRLKKEGKSITGSVMQLFLSKTGTDMGNIDRELEKLICYCMDKDVIEAKDVEAVTTEQTTNKIFEKFEIGDTICDYDNPEALPPIAIDEPTMSMLFTINDSPFFGKEGKYCTSRHIQERLDKELEKNLALRVRPFENCTDKWIVSGRGVLHLSVLIETMRREGYELQVGQPQVIYKTIDGVKCEPIEELTINVPEEFASKMIDMVTRRKGEMTSMESQADRVNIEFEIPSRGIIGLRTNVLTASQGEAIMAHRFKDYQPYKGEIQRRTNGSMIALETGTSYAYAIDKLHFSFFT